MKNMMRDRFGSVSSGKAATVERKLGTDEEGALGSGQEQDRIGLLGGQGSS
jgi:hypothetical protein